MSRSANGRYFWTAGIVALGLLACTVPANLDAVEPIVAGLNDLVVFDPGVHERGLPAVQIQEVDGKSYVDLPPAVHVHRFFYSGDKEFQGPLISGGSTVVVAKHPKTGQTMMIDVMLPAGAPRIAHSKNSISYIYKSQRVEISFQGFPFDADTAIVKHHSGRGIARNLHQAQQQLRQHTRDHLAQSKLIDSLKDVSKETHDLLKGMHVASSDTFARGTDSMKTLTNLIPGATYLKSLSEQRPGQSYRSEINNATRTKERLEAKFVPTNR